MEAVSWLEYGRILQFFYHCFVELGKANISNALIQQHNYTSHFLSQYTSKAFTLDKTWGPIEEISMSPFSLNELELAKFSALFNNRVTRPTCRTKMPPAIYFGAYYEHSSRNSTRRSYVRPFDPQARAHEELLRPCCNFRSQTRMMHVETCWWFMNEMRLRTWVRKAHEQYLSSHLTDLILRYAQMVWFSSKLERSLLHYGHVRILFSFLFLVMSKRLTMNATMKNKEPKGELNYYRKSCAACELGLNGILEAPLLWKTTSRPPRTPLLRFLLTSLGLGANLIMSYWQYRKSTLILGLDEVAFTDYPMLGQYYSTRHRPSSHPHFHPAIHNPID
ncbi:uncharacterized protein BDR25DRAFT_359917 [Lindgomyces ingoldianus]|uniref:Uncharacterized protein n=1 Tax=Lindgomyces ingoldianus TaxID=673940 RepID=A0ACB6QGT6_9PLEO|nr:uncharacterized protein BDR25DRAFT_359917 [Lindgomyces ingoldianus]KAF2466134.1 hypothetical protein BDR25DRAFT_359917 [Lindgomyces ingoldianus]